MKKKSVKVARVFIKTLMSLVLIFSLGALGLSIFNSISFDAEVSKYIYFLIGVFIIPFEFLFTGNLGQVQQQDGNLVGLIVSMVVIVLAIVVLVNSSKMFDGKYSSVKRTLAGTIANVLIFIFLAMFTFSSIMFSIYSSQITNIINSIGPEFVKMFTISYGVNLIFILNIVFAYFGVVSSLLVLVMFILSMLHKSSKIKTVNSIYFYSSQYEEPVQETKVKEEQKEAEEIQESTQTESPQAKELINKIMQLEELKKAGKLTDVQYTKLRQKAIRRYKGWKSFFKILKNL